MAKKSKTTKKVEPKKFCPGAMISFVLGILAVTAISFNYATLTLAILSIGFGIMALIMAEKLNRYGQIWGVFGIIISVFAIILKYVLLKLV